MHCNSSPFSFFFCHRADRVRNLLVRFSTEPHVSHELRAVRKISSYRTAKHHRTCVAKLRHTRRSFNPSCAVRRTQHAHGVRRDYRMLTRSDCSFAQLTDEYRRLDACTVDDGVNAVHAPEVRVLMLKIISSAVSPTTLPTTTVHTFAATCAVV